MLAKPADPLEVVIATAPSGLSLASEARLLRPALLYGDGVRLFSPLATLLSGFAAMAEAEGIERAQVMQALAEAMGVPQASQIAAIEPGIEMILSLPRRERREFLGGKRSNEFRDLLRNLDGVWDELREKVEEILDQAGAQDLVPAIEVGLLDIDPLLDEEADMERMIEEFVSKLGQVLRDGKSYPLFDDNTGSLVRAGIAEGIFEGVETAMKRGREVRAASQFMFYLPAFPNATVEEILDIRKELERPLVQFRSAMVKVGNLLDADPYEAEFEEQVEQVYRSDIAPAIESIREQVETNSYLHKLVGEAVKDLPKWLGAGSIAAATTPWSQVPELIVAGATTVGPAVRAAWEHQQAHLHVRQEQYYFLYETNRLLEN